jgi:DNA-binding LacI/PurR family transcriptional regulator
MKMLTVSAFIKIERCDQEANYTENMLLNQRNHIPERNRATIDDVAKKAGVSTATVSRVINNSGSVAEKTKRNVLNAISELHYRPQSAAQVLASRKTNTIGLLFQGISGDFFSPMLRGIEATARECNHKLLIYSTQGPENFDKTIPLPLGEHNTDGVIVYVDSIPKDELVRLAQMNFPVVLIHQSPPKGIQIPWVTVENKSGARKIVDHLIEVHNYHRIALLAGDENHEDAYWREMGYRESLENHKIPFDPELFAVGGFDREKAKKAVTKWLNNHQKIDAIFASDDDSAIGAIMAINEAGFKVPDDIAVVGFDDIDLSRFLTPPLTTVQSPIEQVGRKAIELLVDQIHGKKTDSLVILPTKVIVRQSCGCQ